MILMFYSVIVPEELASSSTKEWNERFLVSLGLVAQVESV